MSSVRSSRKPRSLGSASVASGSTVTAIITSRPSSAESASVSTGRSRFSMTSRAKSLGAAMSAVPPTRAIGRVRRRNATCLGETSPRPARVRFQTSTSSWGTSVTVDSTTSSELRKRRRRDGWERASKEQAPYARCPTEGVVPAVVRSIRDTKVPGCPHDHPQVVYGGSPAGVTLVTRSDPVQGVVHRIPDRPGVSRPPGHKSSAILEDWFHHVRRPGIRDGMSRRRTRAGLRQSVRCRAV